MVALQIRVHDAGNGYKSIIDSVLDPYLHRVIAPRGEKTFESCSMLIVHHDPTDCLLVGNRPNLSPTLAAVEALQLVGGFSDPRVTVAVAPKYAAFMDGDKFHGAYGPRTRDKLQHVVRRLVQDNATRRAVVTVWDDDLDLANDSLHDYPCTVSLGFQIRDGKLNMRTHMRSNDLWLGYPYDLFQFTTLQRAVAAFLELPVGEYVHFVDSMHVYERDLDKIRDVNVDDERPRMTGGIRVDVPSWPLSDWEGAQYAAQAAFYGFFVIPPAEMNREEEWFYTVMSRWWRKHPEHWDLRRNFQRLRHSWRGDGT